jgi:putative ABC transport system permease protein
VLPQLRIILRGFRRRYGTAAAVVVTLAVCIGATSAIFAIVDALLLRPLPYPDAERLVAVHESNLRRRETEGLLAPVRLIEWARASRSFAAIAGCYFENFTDTSGALPERVETMRVSAGFLQLFATPPARGRVFTAEEERLVAPVAVISDAFWMRRFGRAPDTVGRRLELGGRSYTIVGIMPPAFQAPDATTELWAPMAPLTQWREARILTAFGRLQPGVSAEGAEAELTRIQSQLGEIYPLTDAGWGARVRPLKERQVGGVRRTLWLLFGAVALVLVAACGNVACLLLADASRREHEIAVKLALGASRTRTVGHLCAEGLVLATCGAALGLLIAAQGLEIIRAAAPQLPRLREAGLDARMVAFTAALAGITTVLFSLAPALQATRVEVADRLASGGRGLTGGRMGAPRLLVAAQVALAVVLLTAAGLVVRSFERLQHVESGFSAANVLAFRITAQWAERPEAVAARQLRTLERLRAMPGVTAAAFGSVLPAGATFTPQEFTIDGQAATGARFAERRTVTAEYFRVLEVPLLRGRVCRDDPGKLQSSEILVNRMFVERFFGAADPIGRVVSSGSGGVSFPAEIIGMVGDVRERGLASEPGPMMYSCGLMPYWPDPRYLVRIDDPRRVTVAAIREAVRDIEPARAVYAAGPLVEFVADSIAQPRLNAILLSLFAWTTLLLAAMGLYGVLSQLVTARRREIGLRIALGARPAQILTSVAAQAALVTAAGIAVGLAAAAALARLMASLVFGIAPRDPITFAAVPAILVLVAAVASIVPARRAATTDPMTALRDI